jgi:hypothetical protein
VWSASYVGVWHLGETSGATVADSTVNDFAGTRTTATQPAPLASSLIGGGASFGGGADCIDVGNSALFDVQTLTFETWIRVNHRNDDIVRRIVDLPSGFTYDLVVAYPGALTAIVNTNSIIMDNSAASEARHTPDNSFSANVWHHLVVARNTQRVWIDGVAFMPPTSGTSLAQDNTSVIIGNRQNSNDRAIDGAVDEVRFGAVVRSQAWISAGYANQRADSTFVTIGAVEPAP